MKIKVKYKNNFGLGDKIFWLIYILVLIVGGIYAFYGFIAKKWLPGIVIVVYVIVLIILFIKEKKTNYFEKIIECDSFEVIEGKDKTNN